MAFRTIWHSEGPFNVFELTIQDTLNPFITSTLYSTREKAIRAGKRKFKFSVWNGKPMDLGNKLVYVKSRKVR